MSYPARVVLMLYCLACLRADLASRHISNTLTCGGLVVGILGGMCGWWVWSWIGVALAVVPLVCASLPPGDIKAMAVVGGFLGMSVAWVTLLALFALTGCWWCHQRGWITYPGEWAFFPWCTGATCGIVLLRQLG